MAFSFSFLFRYEVIVPASFQTYCDDVIKNLKSEHSTVYFILFCSESVHVVYMDRGATRVSLMAGTGVRGMGAAPGASGSVGDPVELCAQVHIVVSGLDVQHNTQTVVTLLRALLIQLHSFARSSSSGHLTALMMHTHVKLGVVILQNTEDTQLAIWHFSQCVSSDKLI